MRTTRRSSLRAWLRRRSGGSSRRQVTATGYVVFSHKNDCEVPRRQTARRGGFGRPRTARGQASGQQYLAAVGLRAVLRLALPSADGTRLSREDRCPGHQHLASTTAPRRFRPQRLADIRVGRQAGGVASGDLCIRMIDGHGLIDRFGTAPRLRLLHHEISRF